MKNSVNFYHVIFEMNDSFTLSDVVSRIEKNLDTTLDEETIIRVSVFLDQLIGLGILGI